MFCKEVQVILCSGSELEKERLLEQNGSNNEMEILFQFLRYWGLQHNWNMHNAFTFDNRHGVKAYIKKLKGTLMWNFGMLEHVGIISSNVYSGFLIA